LTFDNKKRELIDWQAKKFTLLSFWQLRAFCSSKKFWNADILSAIGCLQANIILRETEEADRMSALHFCIIS